MSNPVKLSADEAKRLILWILENGIVEPTNHCRCESMPKRNVTMGDVEHVLIAGEIRREPEWEEKHGNWKYRVEGEDVDGDDLIAITVIIEEDATLLILTVF